MKTPRQVSALRHSLKSKKTLLLITAALIIVAIGVAAVVVRPSADSENAKYPKYGDAAAYQRKVERITANQIKPLAGPLKALGFEDAATLESTCRYASVPEPDRAPDSFADSWSAPGDHFQCDSGNSKFMVVPADRNAFAGAASELDKTLIASGWQPLSDRTVTDWVGQLRNNQEAPGDQTYLKEVDGLDCQFSLLASFSDPDPPAITIQFSCGIYD